jgi:hypothetical protein
VESIQHYVDATLGETSRNTSYAVDAERAFSERARDLQEQPAAPSR